MQTTLSTSDSTLPPEGARSSEPLSAYMRDLASLDRLSEDEESASARRLVALRVGLWAAILDYPPFVAPIAALVRSRVPVEVCPDGTLDELEVAARRLRDRRLREYQDNFARLRDEAARLLHMADVEGKLAEIILGDLERLARRAEATVDLRVKSPPRGSAQFERHVEEVRRRHAEVVAARNAFVRANLRLVVMVARSYNRGEMPLQDLIQEGNLGLMKAVDRFDPERGLRFSTYGIWWIRHAIQRSIADKARSVRLPVHMIDAYKRVQRARFALTQELGREPADDELSAASGVSEARIARMRWSLVQAPVSLMQPVTPGTDNLHLDLLVDPEEVSAPERIDAELLHDGLREAFAQLTPKEADILRKRVGLGGAAEMTLKEIGADYSLSRERVRQLQEGALAKLRAEFSRRQLM